MYFNCEQKCLQACIPNTSKHFRTSEFHPRPVTLYIFRYIGGAVVEFFILKIIFVTRQSNVRYSNVIQTKKSLGRFVEPSLLNKMRSLKSVKKFEFYLKNNNKPNKNLLSWKIAFTSVCSCNTTIVNIKGTCNNTNKRHLPSTDTYSLKSTIVKTQHSFDYCVAQWLPQFFFGDYP